MRTQDSDNLVIDSMAGNVVPTYSPAERDRRWYLARSFMDRENVDALIVFGEHEDSGPAPFYLDTWFTNGRPGSTILFPRNGEPIELAPYHLFITDHLESARRGDAVWTKPENFRMGRDAATLAYTITAFRLAKSTIGVVGIDVAPPWHPEGLIPYSLWSKVVSKLPDASFKSVGEHFSRLIMPQSDEELAVVRYAAHIGDEMCGAMVQAAQPGTLESAVVAAGMTTAYSRGTHVPLMHLWSGPEPAASGMPPWSYRAQPTTNAAGRRCYPLRGIWPVWFAGDAASAHHCDWRCSPRYRACCSCRSYLLRCGYAYFEARHPLRGSVQPHDQAYLGSRWLVAWSSNP